MNEIHLVHKNVKLNASAATLTNILNIYPFTYGMAVQQVYDSGNVFAPGVLDVEESALLSYRFRQLRSFLSTGMLKEKLV